MCARRWWGVALLCSAVISSGADFKVLVFSKTAGFRHSSIPDGIQMLRELGTNSQFTVDATEDATQFNDTNLAPYQVVVWLCTTGDVLDANQQAAFERYIRNGGGYVGIHSASDTEYSWPWYGQLVGAYFANHPAIQTATIKVADRVHPSSAPLPERWVRNDEWYNFQSNPRGRVHVLMTLDEKTYAPGSGAMGFDHPIAWCQEYEGGRAWYTGGGHTSVSYSEALFRAHVLGGMEWAGRRKIGDARVTIDSSFQKVVLDATPSNPMELAVAPDGRVFYVERDGRVKIWKPDTATVVVAGQLAVFSQLEDGLLGITLDPGFPTNNWLYLFYSPEGSTPKQHVSRFTMNGDTLDLTSEEILLVIPTQRDQCCHSGGSLAFGPDGNLFASAGDNTNPFESDGYTPIDERPDRSPWDAQKSSANANDLRGKILRIRPQPNGTYSIPAGNLFAPGTANTRPEIYVMGCRNPFRLGVDQRTGWLYWGDVGPDAGSTNANRGPAGLDEWNQARTAGNYGWPYFVGNNFAYRDYDFASLNSGALFNASAPVNLSPNNTGSGNLPAARPAWIWYPYSSSTEFPEVNGGSGRTAMAGPVYGYSSTLVSARKLPAYYDRTVFIYEWSRNYVKEVKLDANGDILKINPFLPSFSFKHPMDMEVGPDGALYMIEWGSNFGGGNSDAKVIRIDYSAGNRGPTSVASATPTSGPVPLTVQFSSAGTTDPEGEPLTFAWSFFGNGATNSTAPNPAFTYNSAGNYAVQLRVFDRGGNVAVANLDISAGNTEPVPAINQPPNGSFFDWGSPIRWAAQVFDAEEGSTTNGAIPCSRLVFQPFLGHNDHSHNLGQFNACQGVFVAPQNSDPPEDNLFLVLDASYRDNGAPGVAPLTGRTIVVLNPKLRQAEHCTSSNGVTPQATSDPLGGGLDITGADDGDWIAFAPMNFTNITHVNFRVAVNAGNAYLELHAGSPAGPLAALASLPVTSGNYTNVTATLTDPGGSHEYFLVFRGGPGAANICQLNWIEFGGSGISTNQQPFSGTPAVIPSTLQAEDFDFGGEGFAYHDTDGANHGGSYRTSEGVDVELTTDSGGGFNVGWIDANEWLEYTVNVLTAGVYRLEARVASASGGGPFHVEFNGVDKTGPLIITNTGGWQTYRTLAVTNVALSSGVQVMRVAFDSGGIESTSMGNVNWLRLVLLSVNQPPGVTLVSPSDGAEFSAPGPVTITANAADVDGSIMRVDFYDGPATIGFDVTSPFSLVWGNVARGSHTLSAVAVDNVGATVTSAAVNITVGPAPLTTTLIPTGAVWRYLDNNSDQGTAWRQSEFDDNAWGTGWAKFGFGDPATSVINIGPEGARWTTTYFRRVFDVTNAWGYTNLAFRVLRDDGVVIHLNGAELFRMNMPLSGPITFNHRASSTVGGTDESTYYSTNLAGFVLAEGRNVLAVELHQSSPDTSDAGFDLELVSFSINALLVERDAPGILLRWTSANAVLEESTNLSTWSGLPNARSPYSIFVGNGTRFYRLRLP